MKITCPLCGSLVRGRGSPSLYYKKYACPACLTKFAITVESMNAAFERERGLDAAPQQEA